LYEFSIVNSSRRYGTHGFWSRSSFCIRGALPS
jgi:hypothetical protein